MLFSVGMYLPLGTTFAIFCGGMVRGLVDKLRDKLGASVVVLGSAESAEKLTLIAGVSKDLTAKVKAGELVGFVAGQVGGKGGGKPDLAQGGGTNVAGLDAALASVMGWVEAKI